MSSKYLAVSAAALLIGLSAPAFAQTYTLNGVEVPADQVARLQEYCASLETEATASLATEEDDADTNSTSADASATGEDESSDPSTTIDFATLDVTTIDADACIEGGFIAADADAEAEATTTTTTTTTTPAPAPSGATTTPTGVDPSTESLNTQDGVDNPGDDGTPSTEDGATDGEGSAPAN